MSLAAIGITYDLTGTNGVTIGVGDERVKSSHVSRIITRAQLEKRLGPFKPRDPEIVVEARNLLGDRLPEAFRADEYREEQARWRNHQKDKREARAASAARPGTAAEVARAAAKERAAARKVAPKRPPPDLESWYYARREGAYADRWRKRRRVAALFALAGSQRQDAALPDEIDGYRAYPCSDGRRYARGPDDPTAFVDRGPRVEVVLTDDASMLAALRLATIKFGGKVTVRGSEVLRDRIYTIAIAAGLGEVLTDADLVARREADLREAAAAANTAARPSVSRFPVALPTNGPRGPQATVRKSSEPGEQQISSGRQLVDREGVGDAEPPIAPPPPSKPKRLTDLARELGRTEHIAKSKGPLSVSPLSPPGRDGQDR